MIIELLMYILVGILITLIFVGVIYAMAYVYYSAQENPWVGIIVFGAIIGILLYVLNPFKF